MQLNKMLISGVLGVGLFLGSMGIGHGAGLTYTVQEGDSFWKISQKFSVSVEDLMTANSANGNTEIYSGQVLNIPTKEQVHVVKSGDTFWTISKAYGINFQELLSYNDADENSWLNIGDEVKIPTSSTDTGTTIDMNTDTSTDTNDNTNTNITQNPYVTYTKHTIKSGDDVWKLSLEYGVPMYELLDVNKISENTILNIGDVVTIPVHNVPIKSTPGSKYGEYLDWWTEAQYVVPIGAEFTVADFETGKRFKTKRTIGANHADCEPLTKTDADIMKAVWGGNYSWDRRPAVIEYEGRKIAASVASEPHSIQYIKDNDFSGHFDIHFANSTRHKDGEIDWKHQANIKRAAGIE